MQLSYSSLSSCCHDPSHAQKKNREGTCLIKCPSTSILIVLKTESYFSPFKAFRHQKCRFLNNGPQSGVFPCKCQLIRDLCECTPQHGRKKRMTKRLCVTNLTGLLHVCFDVIFAYINVFWSFTKGSV